MKKALVIACILVAGFSLFGSAQGMCSGEWTITLDVDLGALSDDCVYWPGAMFRAGLAHVFTASSSLTLNYGVGAFLFGSTSQFDAVAGYTSQAFDVTGALGAFTLTATMTFLPQAVVLSEQRFIIANQPEEWTWLLYNNEGDDCDACGEPCCNCPKETDDQCDLTVLVREPVSWNKVCELMYCSMLEDPILTIEPRFKNLEVSLAVNIAGIEIEGLKLLNAWEGTVTEEQIFEWEICTEEWEPFIKDSNAYFANVVQSGPDIVDGDPPAPAWWECEHNEWFTGIWAVGTDVLQTCSCTTGGIDDIGSGFRLKLAGVAGPISVTSYTYFNMTESDNKADTDSGCPVLGKKGDYEVAGDCALGFNEEYLMVEGIPLCCDMVVDAALKMVCPEEVDTWTCVCETDELEKTTLVGPVGPEYTISFPNLTPPDCTKSTEIVAFEYLWLLVHDIPFVPGMMDLTASIKLTTDEKEFSLCGQPAFDYPTCFSITLLANWEEDEAHNEIANKLTGIDIKDLSFTCECNGVTFTSTTVLYDLPTNALNTLDSREVLSFLVPLDCTTGTDPDGVTYEPCPPFRDNDGDGTLSEGDKILLEYWETPKYKYYAWESFSVAIDGDACCGGAFDFDIDTYIGKKYEANPEFCGCICEKDPKKVCCEDVPVLDCNWSLDPNYEEVGKLGSLFSWMKTEVSATIGIFSNFDLLLETMVSFRGWETFSLGFAFTI